MAKAGIGAEAVAAMAHAELAAWFDDILLSMGVKKAKESEVIISRRMKKPQEQTNENITASR